VLFDELAENVFDLTGRVTSLAAFDGDLGIGNLTHRDSLATRVTALALAGRRKRASELIESGLPPSAAYGYGYAATRFAPNSAPKSSKPPGHSSSGTPGNRRRFPLRCPRRSGRGGATIRCS
jgi:hypothetical protein